VVFYLGDCGDINPRPSGQANLGGNAHKLKFSLHEHNYMPKFVEIWAYSEYDKYQ
jgi:hypothetical protein